MLYESHQFCKKFGPGTTFRSANPGHKTSSAVLPYYSVGTAKVMLYESFGQQILGVNAYLKMNNQSTYYQETYRSINAT